jgi:hypothetical protein
MHDVQSKWTRYALFFFGITASLICLGVSAVANWRYGHTLARTEFDGHMYGAALAAGDVLMALMPFFFFAAVANFRVRPGKATIQMLASLVLWLATTVVAFQAAVSHSSTNRLDAASTRTVTATAYADVRTELTEAREARKRLQWHRPEATVKAEIEKHKTQRQWTLTTECTEPAGKAAREYCAQYQTFVSELGSAQQAAKLDTRIAELTAKSDKLTETSGNVVVSEADAGASTWARLFKIDLREMQSWITLALAGFIWLAASLGPYSSAAVLTAGRRAVVIDGVAVEEPPQPLTPVGAKALPPPSPPPPKVTRPEPGPEGRTLLDAVGWPPKRPKTLQARDTRDDLPWRFLAWLVAHKLDGEEYESPRFEALYAEMAATENREPWAWRIAGREMWTHPKYGGNKLGRLGCAKRERPEKDGRTRTYFLVPKVAPARVLDQLAKRGFKPTSAPPPDPPPPTGGNVHRLPLPVGAGSPNSSAPKNSGDNRPDTPPTVARLRVRFPLAWGAA